MSARAAAVPAGRTPAGRAVGALLIAVALCAVFGPAGQLLAGSFAVNPARIVLSSRSQSALLALTNQSGDTSNVELSVMAWSEGPDGKPALESTSDLVVIPPIATLPPRGTRNVRIARRRSEAVGTERAYRLMVKEMPPSKAATERTGVRLVMHLAVPVYVQPARPGGAVLADSLQIVRGHVRAHLTHQGNAHATLDSAMLVGTTGNGQQRFVRQLDIWGLLAGASRDIDVPLTADECLGTSGLELRLRQGGKDSSRALNVDASSCVN